MKSLTSTDQGNELMRSYVEKGQLSIWRIWPFSVFLSFLYSCKLLLTLNPIAALSRDLSLYRILPHFCWQHRDPAASLQRFSP